MKKGVILILCIICSFIAGSYFSNFSATTTKQNMQNILESIDSLCNSEPRKACEMLDSIESQTERMDDRTRYKFHLLRIKAHDKAFVTHTHLIP